MPTYARIIIVVTLFLLLLAYEFFHIRGNIKKYSKDEKDCPYLHSGDTKNYIIMASISYSILNIIIILLFIFLFPNHIFLSYKKLVCLGTVILAFILINNIISNNINNESLKLLTIIELFALLFVAFLSPSLLSYEFSYITTKENTTTIISNVTNVTKAYDKDKNIVYLVSYDEKNEGKKIALYENETEFSISDKSYVDKTTTTYIYIEQELKDTKENTRKQENIETYGIYVSKDLVTDYTD